MDYVLVNTTGGGKQEQSERYCFDCSQLIFSLSPDILHSAAEHFSVKQQTADALMLTVFQIKQILDRMAILCSTSHSSAKPLLVDTLQRGGQQRLRDDYPPNISIKSNETPTG